MGVSFIWRIRTVREGHGLDTEDDLSPAEGRRRDSQRGAFTWCEMSRRFQPRLATNQHGEKAERPLMRRHLCYPGFCPCGCLMTSWASLEITDSFPARPSLQSSKLSSSSASKHWANPNTAPPLLPPAGGCKAGAFLHLGIPAVQPYLDRTKQTTGAFP